MTTAPDLSQTSVPLNQPSADNHPASDNSQLLPATNTWQADPAAQKILNAFILGWSIVELRSRIQIAALDDDKLPPAAKDTSSQANLAAIDPVLLVKGTNDRLLRGSRMRTVFNAIVTLQRAKFPTSITLGTLYDPPDQTQLPYLYPPEPDYANIGINPIGVDGAGKPVWADFRLFEITRRAINCLTLLLVNPGDSLVPSLVAGQQSRVIAEILKAADQECADSGTDASAPAATVRSLVTTVVRACNDQTLPASEASAPNAGGSAPRNEHGKAIITLAFLTVRLLQAWDGYLRERFTAEGVGANNLLSLLAYEAGRNMAALSWHTSVNAVTLNANDNNKEMDEALNQVWQDTFNDSNCVQLLHQITALSAVLDDAYYRVNKKPEPVDNGSPNDLLQRPDPALPSQVLLAVKQSIEFWQRTVSWLGTGRDVLTDTGLTKKPLTLAEWEDLRGALIEQSGIWFNLMTGQQDLRGFSVENVTHQILDEAITNFRNMAQRDLPAATQQAAQQVSSFAETAVDSVADMSQVATNAAKQGIGRLLRTVNPILWVVIAVSSTVVVGLVIYVLLNPTQAQALIAALTSLITAGLSVLGLKLSGDAKSKSEQEVTQVISSKAQDTTAAMQQKKDALQTSLADAGTGLASTVSAALGQTGSYLVQAYERGLARIQIELQSLNYSVAVAHPLIELVIRHYGVEGDLDFLNKVIWDNASRQAQLDRVVTAAFGPLSLLLGPGSTSAPQSPVSNTQAK